MSRFATFLLLGLAIAAALFLWLVEPRWQSTRERLATRDFVFRFDPAAITGVRVIAGRDGYELFRRPDGWWIGPKPRDVASLKMVGDLLKAAAELRVYDVIRVDELRDGRDLDDFGLEKPKSQLDLVGDGDPTLFFGKEAAGDGRIYVRKGDSNEIYVVSDALQQFAFRNAEAFRSRRLTNLRADQISGFTIVRGPGRIEVARDDFGWRIVSPFRARADAAAVDRLLDGVLGLEITDFVADESDDLSAYGLGEPRAEITMQVDGASRPIALRIGADVTADGKKSVLAQFTARDSVYHLPESAWKQLQVAPDDLRDRQLMALNLDTVDAIRFREGEKSWSIRRDGEGWKSSAALVAAATVEHLTTKLAAARVARYLPLTAENLRRTGLEKPAGEIRFDAWLSENTPETTAGQRPVATLRIGTREKGEVYVRVNEDAEICAIPAEALDGMAATPR